MNELILIVDDEPAILDFLEINLNRAGFSVARAEDGKSGFLLAKEKKPSLIVLDIMLPDISGLDVCQQVQNELKIPVILLTAKDEDIDKIIGLEMGADDYITKPFNPRELVARIKAILRRSTQPEPFVNRLCFDKLVIDVVGGKALLENKQLELTPKEYDLLRFLASSPGKVFGREELLKTVWGYEDFIDLRTVDVHIRRLREKLRFDYIQTIRGVGYRFKEFNEGNTE